MTSSNDHEEERFRTLLALTKLGDLAGIRALVAEGLDPTALAADGTPLLERVLFLLDDRPAGLMQQVVKTLLELGADARQRSPDGTGPLYLAVIDMDTEMLRILMDAGADPNDERMDSEFETLYDWARCDYSFEVWRLGDYGCPTDADLADEDSWLRFLDRQAIEQGRRRPDHLMLLRERGARSMAELSELPGSPHFGVFDKLMSQFDLRFEAPPATPGLEHTSIQVYTSISIDGEPIEPQQYVDVLALVESLRSSGRFEIFVCGCAKPRECGLAFHGVEVTQGIGGTICWDLHRPQLASSENMPNAGILGPEARSSYWFKRSQMVAAIRSYLNSLRAFAAKRQHRVEWPIDGQSIYDVLQLELPG